MEGQVLMDDFKFISIVIPSYNRIEKLKNCLTSIEHLDYPKEYYEVIVVDDGSTDMAYRNLEAIRTQFTYNLCIIRQKNGGPAIARNNGIRNARGELIAFTDDDCEVDKKWLKEGIRAFTSESIVGVGGMLVSKHNDIISQYMDWNRILLPKVQYNRVIYLITANAFYRKDSLIKVNGFNEKIKNPGGEDPDLSFKLIALGFELAVNKDSIVTHNHRLGIGSFYKTFYNYGRGTHVLYENWRNVVVIDEPTKTPLVFLIFDFRSLCRSILGRYKMKMRFRRSIVFALLDHIRMIAGTSGRRKGY